MGSYVEIGELKTWYDEQGSGEPLVLLHGGISTNETWGAQMPDFGARFRVIAPEWRGHGHTPDLEGPLSYDVMANDTIGFLRGGGRRPGTSPGLERRWHRRIARCDGPSGPSAEARRHQREF